MYKCLPKERKLQSLSRDERKFVSEQIQLDLVSISDSHLSKSLPIRIVELPVFLIHTPETQHTCDEDIEEECRQQHVECRHAFGHTFSGRRYLERQCLVQGRYLDGNCRV